jgi:uroporphyrin-III C-methyltransferase / precorrin-2 dehydrogenase / sirohydrochlorin ferrochelatase
VHSLPIFVRLKGRPVILLGDGAAADAKRALLMRAGADVVGEESLASLAIVALDDDAVALPAIARLKARGILVNAVDRPAQCDFTLPAIVDRAPALIAVGTGGASAGLAKSIRIRLETILPATLGRLADGMAQARDAIRTRWPDARERRLAIDRAFEHGGPLDPFCDVADDAVSAWLKDAVHGETSAFYRIAIASDDPDQLTLFAARMLGRADVVYHHPNIASTVLVRARADAVLIACTAPPRDIAPGLTLFLDRV